MRIVIARNEDPPFPVDAEALEEDSWLALSAPAGMITTPDHPVRVMTGVWEAEPEPLGSVVVKRTTPMRLLAVVHDLNAVPSCSEKSVAEAIDAILDTCRRLHVDSLKLPPLGALYGDIDPMRFATVLGDVLERVDAGTAEPRPQRIWLVRGRESGTELAARLVGRG